MRAICKVLSLIIFIKLRAVHYKLNVILIDCKCCKFLLDWRLPFFQQSTFADKVVVWIIQLTQVAKFGLKNIVVRTNSVRPVMKTYDQELS